MLISHLRAKLYYYMSNVSATKVSVCFCVILSFLFVLEKIIRKRKNVKEVAFMSVYLTVVAMVTLIGRTDGVENNLESSLNAFIKLSRGRIPDLFDLGFNIALFIPFGLLLAEKNHYKKILLCSFALSLFIETIQLILSLGLFQFEDLIMNTLGGLLGAILYKSMKYIAMKRV